MEKLRLKAIHDSKYWKVVPRNKILRKWYRWLYQDRIRVSEIEEKQLSIEFVLKQDHVTICIYDVLGRSINESSYLDILECTVYLPKTGFHLIHIKSQEVSFMIGAIYN